MKDKIVIRSIEYENVLFKNFLESYNLIFWSLDWIKMFGDSIMIYSINKGDEIIGAFYLYKERKFGVRYFKSPPYTPNIGLIFKNTAINRSKINSNNKQVLSSIASFLKKLNCEIILFQLPIYIKDAQPFLWDKFKVSISYTYLIQLDNKEKVMNNYDSSLKSDISKAIRDGIVVEKIEDYSIIKKLVVKTFKRQNLSVSLFLDKILFEFATPLNSFAFVSFKNDAPSACVFCVFDEAKAYYIISGYDNNNIHRGAGPLALHSAIEYAEKLGLKYFDFEGSMLKNIESYFRGFGGILTPKIDIHRATLPIELFLKFAKRNIY